MSSATSETNPSSIGRRLTAARRHLGWSREAVAFKSGLSWSAIAQIESGRRTNVRPTTLYVLADALGVTVDYLLGRGGGSMIEHHALVYATPGDFAEEAGAFIAEGLERSEATLVVTTGPKIRLLRKRLGLDASEVRFADAVRWYTTPTAALTAYRLFIEQKLEAGAGWVRILGEPVWSGRSPAEVRLWAQYESLLNLELAALPVTLVCPYDGAALSREILDQARMTHQHTRARADVAANPEYREPCEFTLAP
jgi:transcriptional regulator with XRE-family HTH domain